GTILAVMLGPMSLPGVLVMRDRVRLLLPHIAAGVGTYAVFSNLGARLAYALDHQGLTLAFAALLVLLGLHYIGRKQRDMDGLALDPDRPTVLTTGHIPLTVVNVGIIGAGIGVAGGLFGIGAGVLMVPILISAIGLHKDDARALSLAILLPPVSVGAVLEYHQHDGIDWIAAGIILVAYFATNLPGAALGRQHGARRFLRVTGVVLLVLGAMMGATAVLPG
ncbi:MAG: sulfite exporter TauE/SafE family protein, partial [Myxococcota bacterium]|nr:sulfite exporter TauE/SafE family protein [Myxococcota bacterium]